MATLAMEHDQDNFMWLGIEEKDTFTNVDYSNS